MKRDGKKKSERERNGFCSGRITVEQRGDRAAKWNELSGSSGSGVVASLG